MSALTATPTARATATAKPRRARFPRMVLLFLAPFFVLYGIFTILPLLYSLGLSLYSEQTTGGLGFGGTEQVFVGLDNFTQALGDSQFLTGFVNVLLYCLVYIPVMISVALVLALLLDSAAAKARPFFRLALFVPHIVPALIAAIIWLYLYTPGVSPLIEAFETAGGTWDLTSRLSALFALGNLATWLHLGYNVILFYAALQAIPGEVLEAASIDGAGPIRTAVQIKARMILGAVTVAVLFTVVGAMQLFAEPLLLASRAPAISSTWTPNMFIYQTAFVQQDMGYAAASAVLFAAVIGVLSWLVTRVGRKASS
ncbi:carbohydrate ABC transporter permease [Antribacter gilvus]|uniref:carbohydrate ABC transporter permease n=1 Tax=Antribacter gilvus TaxID=2304675 RepID=UPI000F785A07|nr:sugar ABC transporter permease [Antribacter gilvus]